MSFLDEFSSAMESWPHLVHYFHGFITIRLVSSPEPSWFFCEGFFTLRGGWLLNNFSMDISLFISFLFEASLCLKVIPGTLAWVWVSAWVKLGALGLRAKSHYGQHITIPLCDPPTSLESHKGVCDRGEWGVD